LAYQITQKLLSPNRYSRPQTPLKQITKIALHYVGDAGASALAIRNYFESLKAGKTQIIKGETVYKYASSHYVIGLEGEVIQCLPEAEISYCTNSANSYSISIEVCHPKWDGKYNDSTYNTMVELCVDLCQKYGLNPLTDLIRHYDVTKKICPKWFVEHPDEWQKFKERVQTLKDIKEGKVVDANIPQWKYNSIIWAKSVGLLNSDHSPTEQLDMGTMCEMLKHFVEIYKLNK
jgi:N-acetylmuramoyl-L-alanine amidase CwlA